VIPWHLATGHPRLNKRDKEAIFHGIFLFPVLRRLAYFWKQNGKICAKSLLSEQGANIYNEIAAASSSGRKSRAFFVLS
jgi:hypothetical protein